MSQFPHDDFVKEYLPELCNNYGTATSSVDVKSETRQVDVFFIPDKPVPTTPETLGLLGKLAQQTCLFEIYRNPIQATQIRECISKLLSVQENEIRKAKRDKSSLILTPLPILWILSPTVSENILAEFNALAQDNWLKGIYFPPAGFFTGIVAIHQLPVTRDTLWLRILGRGKVQAKAIQELKALPEGYDHRESVLELVYGLLEILEANQRKSKTIESEETELIMSLRTVFQEKLAATERLGFEQGIQQGIQQQITFIMRMLNAKIGNLSPELESQVRSLPINELQDLGIALLNFSSLEDLISWLENN